MSKGAVYLLVGGTAFGAYWLGQSGQPPSGAAIPRSAAIVAYVPPSPDPVPTQPSPAPAQVQRQSTAAPAGLVDKKRELGTVLTVAAIAALIVEASRRDYHATGRPCACPDDRMRNGRACGGRSAYSRPGGAAPLCYPHDVPAALIEQYRNRVAQR